MGYWDGVKSRWGKMKKGELPLNEPLPESGSPPPPPNVGPPPADMIRQKFREWAGREPYSDQELQDWWDSL